MSSNEIINQNIQIIQVLCRQTVTADALLAGLQSRFPTAGWTAELLSTRIAQGVKEGRLTPVANSPYVAAQGYKVNYNMTRLNAVNKIYECFCSSILETTPFASGVQLY